MNSHENLSYLAAGLCSRILDMRRGGRYFVKLVPPNLDRTFRIRYPLPSPGFYTKKAPTNTTAVKIVTPEYCISCQNVHLPYLCFFQHSFGLAIPVVGSLSNNSSRSGMVGGQMAYLIGSQHAVKQSNQSIGGQNACVNK